MVKYLVMCSCAGADFSDETLGINNYVVGVYDSLVQAKAAAESDLHEAAEYSADCQGFDSESKKEARAEFIQNYLSGMEVREISEEEESELLSGDLITLIEFDYSSDFFRDKCEYNAIKLCEDYTEMIFTNS